MLWDETRSSMKARARVSHLRASASIKVDAIAAELILQVRERVLALPGVRDSPG